MFDNCIWFESCQKGCVEGCPCLDYTPCDDIDAELDYLEDLELRAEEYASLVEEFN